MENKKLAMGAKPYDVVEFLRNSNYRVKNVDVCALPKGWYEVKFIVQEL